MVCSEGYILRNVLILDFLIEKVLLVSRVVVAIYHFDAMLVERKNNDFLLCYDLRMMLTC